MSAHGVHTHLRIILCFVCLLVYIITAPEGERVYDKKHSCFFFHKEYAKIAHHLEQVHGGEEEVQAALKHPANAPERAQLFEKLCRMVSWFLFE